MITVCDVCSALFLGAAWCHDQRTSEPNRVPARPAPEATVPPELLVTAAVQALHTQRHKGQYQTCTEAICYHAHPLLLPVPK